MKKQELIKQVNDFCLENEETVSTICILAEKVKGGEEGKGYAVIGGPVNGMGNAMLNAMERSSVFAGVVMAAAFRYASEQHTKKLEALNAIRQN